ncbi:zf-TFIIB domain-containing protein [Myxococcota bacterium]
MSPVKPSSTEEEFFAREEAEKKRRLALDKAKEVAGKEREELQKLHYMRCPKCGMELNEIAYRGVLVDKCFHCYGIWLDDGEMEKLAGEDGYWSKVLGFFSRKDFKDKDG